MCDQPRIDDARRNWKESELPFAEKLALAAKNHAKKIATLSSCCGNPGEPGC